MTCKLMIMCPETSKLLQKDHMKSVLISTAKHSTVHIDLTTVDSAHVSVIILYDILSFASMAT